MSYVILMSMDMRPGFIIDAEYGQENLHGSCVFGTFSVHYTYSYIDAKARMYYRNRRLLLSVRFTGTNYPITFSTTHSPFPSFF